LGSRARNAKKGKGVGNGDRGKLAAPLSAEEENRKRKDEVIGMGLQRGAALKQMSETFHRPGWLSNKKNTKSRTERSTATQVAT